jgi:hypothetical protein
MLNKESRKDKDFARALYLHENNILLIRASAKLKDIGGCSKSTA